MQSNDSNAKVPVEIPAPADSVKARGKFDLRSSVKKQPQNMKYWAYAGGALVALIAGLAILWSFALSAMSEGSTDIDESQVQADTMLKSASGSDEAMRIAREAKARKIAEEEARRKGQEARPSQAQPQTAPASKPPVSPPASSPPQNSGPPLITAMQRKLAGGVVVKNAVVAGSMYAQSPNSSQQALPTGGGSDADLLGASGDSSGSPSSRGSFANLSGTTFKPSKAYLAPPGKYLLRHNTYASCALYTEVITDHPGLVECRLTEPLYSADGSTVIAEAGAALTGEQRVEVRPGQSRVYTNWTELETSSGIPNVPGIRARIDSLGAGQMGASGTKAWVDNHLLERYGGAVMLSAFQDLLSAASNSTQQSGSGYTVNNSEQNVENMASKALDANININPTGYLLPGTILTVIVARDIDFSSVYENR